MRQAPLRAAALLAAVALLASASAAGAAGPEHGRWPQSRGPGGCGGELLVANGWEGVAAYDPAIGRERWRGPGMDSNAVQMPLHGDGLAFFAAGRPRRIVMAVRRRAALVRHGRRRPPRIER